jgi:hypothetical protein
MRIGRVRYRAGLLVVKDSLWRHRCSVELSQPRLACLLGNIANGADLRSGFVFDAGSRSRRWRDPGKSRRDYPFAASCVLPPDNGLVHAVCLWAAHRVGCEIAQSLLMRRTCFHGMWLSIVRQSF